MKKTYITPEVKSYDIISTSLMQASVKFADDSSSSTDTMYSKESLLGIDLGMDLGIGDDPLNSLMNFNNFGE